MQRWFYTTKRTASGAYVFCPFRPFRLGVVFPDAHKLSIAKKRYWTIIVMYGIFCFNLRNVPGVDDASTFFSLLLLSFPAAYLILFVAMPGRTIYRRSVHGDVIDKETELNDKR